MDTQAIESLLLHHPLFRWLDTRYIHLLAETAAYEQYRDGEILFRTGEKALQFFIIIHGAVTIERVSRDGQCLVIQKLGDGDVYGWSWLFPPFTWHFDAQARDVTSVLAFDARRVRDACEENHDLGYELMKRFSSILLDRLYALQSESGP